LGTIDNGVLETIRWPHHYHKRLQGWRIARYPLDHAEIYGFNFARINHRYDVQGQLARAIEELGPEQDTPLVAVTIDVIAQMDHALEELKFKRADFWPPDIPEWKPNKTYRKWKAAKAGR
jgi:hypothetical protein